ncbi:hypothetical protein ACHAWF_015405 [Thalassiosira exigua]
MMLALKVPEVDKSGRLPVYYAKKSKHKFVRDWAAERKKPLTLERNVKKLLRLINTKEATYGQLKSFITSSLCFDTETWSDCGFRTIDDKGPLGYSFGDLLNECCSKCQDRDVIFWLCSRLYFSNEDFNCDVFWRAHHFAKKKKLSRDDLLAFAENRGYDDIAHYLPHKYFKKLSLVDPEYRHSLLNTTLSNDELLQEVRVKILRRIVLQEITQVSDTEYMDFFERGSDSPDELDEILQMNSKAKEALVNEGYSGPRRSPLCTIDLSTYIGCMSRYYDDEHSIMKLIPFRLRNSRECKVPIILATEGFSDLLEFCLKNLHGWTIEMELDFVRIAAFFGHSSMLDILLHSDNVPLLSDSHNRYQAAMLGTGEACRCRELVQSIW